MYSTYEKRIVDRLTSLVNEITGACEAGYDYHDRIRAFKGFCDETPVISQMLEDLPDTTYDFGVNWRDLDKIWPGGIESYGMRWNAITQIVSDSEKVHSAWPQLAPARGENMSTGLHRFTNMFVVPIYDFIIDRIESASVISYTLLRYKRWAEWFEADRLRKQYEDHENQGEAVLDEDLRKFLFESGID